MAGGDRRRLERSRAMRNTEQSLPMLLLRAREATMSRFRPILSDNELTEQQWRVLRVLQEHNGLDARELAQRTLMLQPSLTGVIDRLERDGLVERRPHADDRRRVRLMLTRKARRLYQRIAPLIEQEYAAMQASFSSTRWAALHDALNHLVQLNGHHPAGQGD